jgi:hypothetical protein
MVRVPLLAQRHSGDKHAENGYAYGDGDEKFIHGGFSRWFCIACDNSS